MKKTEVLLILLLAALALCQPAVLIARSFDNLAARKEASRPFAGTARVCYEEHAELLNASAEILWQHPEFFEQYRLEGENDGQFPAYEIQQGRVVQHPFSDDQWQTLLQLTGQTWLGGIWYNWGKVPSLTFAVQTSEDGRVTLLYLHQEGYPAYDVERELRYRMQMHDRYVHITDTDWYLCY